MSKNIKLRVYLTPQQYSMFSNALFACQMFRNHCLSFLKNCYFQKKRWLKLNAESPEYLAYLQENTQYLAALKTFKELYSSKAEQKAHKSEIPVKPTRFHQLLESNSVALNAELTAQLDKAKIFLLKNLPAFTTHLEQHGISLPKKSPQNMCVFYNSLPLFVRKALGKMARNEHVLLYVLGSPRSCLVQVVQDLDTSFTKAFKDYEKRIKLNGGKAGQHSSEKIQSGFPKFKKIQRCGGIRFQLDDRHTSLTHAWSNQQIVSSEFGKLNWNDSGYVLPKSPAKMLTLKKHPNGHIHAVFYGTSEYNDKRQAQHTRAVARKTIVSPASSIEEFFNQHTVAIDLNRHSGQIQVVTDIEQNDGTHVVSLADKELEDKRLKKIHRRQAYIKSLQQKLARQDIARKKGRGARKNPNGLHRTGKHSARRLQTQDKIAKACQKESNQALQHMRDLTQQLIDGQRIVFSEDLAVQSMLKSNTSNTKGKTNKRKRKNNNRSQIRARFSMFMNILKDECAKNGVVLLKCDRYDPSSQLCSSCGYHWGKLDTNVREIICLGCGTTHDRDVNATKNIKFLSLYRYAQTLEKDINTETQNAKEKEKLIITQKCAEMHNIKQLGLDPNEKPLAESVNGRQMSYTHLSEITHEDLMLYINGSYPIKTVLETIEKLHAKHRKASLKPSDKQTVLPNSCATTHHPRFSKNHGTTVSTAEFL